MAEYEQLIAVFHEFRQLAEPAVRDDVSPLNPHPSPADQGVPRGQQTTARPHQACAGGAQGVPDYSAAAMAAQLSGLRVLQGRLAALEPDSWPVRQRSDFYIVRSEMAGLEFFHRVTRPWARDPVFYLLAGHEGPTVAGFDGVLLGRRGRMPTLSAERKAELLTKLKAMPALYEQAIANLSEGGLADCIGDMAGLALSPTYGLVKDVASHRQLAETLAESEPDLSAAAEAAAVAVEEFGEWISAHKHEMLAPGGVGIENYDWWLKHVHLFPYTWADCHAIVMHECKCSSAPFACVLFRRLTGVRLHRLAGDLVPQAGGAPQPEARAAAGERHERALLPQPRPGAPRRARLDARRGNPDGAVRAATASSCPLLILLSADHVFGCCGQ